MSSRHRIAVQCLLMKLCGMHACIKMQTREVVHDPLSNRSIFLKQQAVGCTGGVIGFNF